jgi:hypothetical protein
MRVGGPTDYCRDGVIVTGDGRLPRRGGEGSVATPSSEGIKRTLNVARASLSGGSIRACRAPLIADSPRPMPAGDSSKISHAERVPLVETRQLSWTKPPRTPAARACWGNSIVGRWTQRGGAPAGLSGSRGGGPSRSGGDRLSTRSSSGVCSIRTGGGAGGFLAAGVSCCVQALEAMRTVERPVRRASPRKRFRIIITLQTPLVHALLSEMLATRRHAVSNAVRIGHGPADP